MDAIAGILAATTDTAQHLDLAIDGVLAAAVLTFIGTVIGIYAVRRKNNADASGVVANGAKSLVEGMAVEVAHLRKELEDTRKEVEQLRLAVEQLTATADAEHEENVHLKLRVKGQEQKIRELQAEVNALEARVSALKTENDVLRAENKHGGVRVASEWPEGHPSV